MASCPIWKYPAATNGIAGTASVLVDSDIFIDHLRGVRELDAAANRLHYSMVTRCELFARRATEEETIRQLLAPLVELGLSPRIAELAGRIRRNFALRTPDALIAATALEHKLVLWTRNVRHFGRVADLDVRSPG